jgi:hypothetical protein
MRLHPEHVAAIRRHPHLGAGEAWRSRKIDAYRCAACGSLYASASDAQECCWANGVDGYQCNICKAVHATRDTADRCCPEHLSPIATSHPCPICLDRHHSLQQAADCCLWKDLAVPQRAQVAAAVAMGSTWRDALEKVR